MRKVLIGTFWLITLALAACTATANFHYGMLIGAGPERYIYAIGGTLLDVGKTLLPIAIRTFLVGPRTVGTFFRRYVAWSVWGLAVVWSLACALGLYAIVKESKVGDTAGQQASYQQLVSDKGKKEAAQAALVDLRTLDAVDGEIAARKRDRLWTRTKECTDATAPESRTFCADIDRLQAERASVRPAAAIQAERERLKRELGEIDKKLSVVDMATVMQKADPAGESLAKFLGWEVDTLKNRLAFLIALLFECAGLLPWIIHGSHAPAPAARREDPPEAPSALVETPAGALRQQVELPPTAGEVPRPAIELPEVDSVAAIWAKDALAKRKGSFVPAGEMFEQFRAWCRANGHPEISQTAYGKQMTVLGFERRKISGSQRYVDVALVPKAAGLRLAVVNG